MSDLAERVLAKLRGEIQESGKPDAQPKAITPTENESALTPQEAAQQCFNLNAWCHHNAPPIRKERYPKGTMVEIESPAFGRFTAEVLREDDGVTLWVWNPFVSRETAVPNSWIVGEAHD